MTRWLWLAVSLVAACAWHEPNPGYAADQVCFNMHCVTVELAKTEDERTKGLQQREHLADHSGMLFFFPASGRHGFWMKDTLIPLDIIWLDEAKQVVHVAENIPPCTSDPCSIYQAPGPALYVLEINAGQASRWDIKPGAQAEFRLNQTENP